MNAIDQAMNLYHQPPAEGEIDLVQTVRQILAESGLGLKLPEAYDLNQHIQSAIGKNEIVQRHWLNRYFNLQLLSASQQSTSQRYCLIPNGSTEEWLRLFKAQIVPFCIANDLPRVL